MSRLQYYIDNEIDCPLLEASSISKNIKTLQSVDFTTDCPKRRAGNPCPYCYVEVARNMHFNAKKVIEHTAYQGELLGYTKEKIKKLNDMGGIRLFSFGDYMPEHDKDIKEFLDDAKKVGLKVKAITKVPEFVEKYANHPAMNVINVSIDTIGEGMNHETALALKKKYKNVMIRTVILKPEDLKHEIMQDVDVYTFNHGRGLKKYGYKKYSKAEVSQFAKDIPGKVCCATGRCATCDVKCGQNSIRS